MTVDCASEYENLQCLTTEEQAERDTKFYNILIKMLCEVKSQQAQKQREYLKKVYAWYQANKHTLRTGPRFGKENQKLEAKQVLKGTLVSARSTLSSASRPNSSPGKQKSDKTRSHKDDSSFQKFVKDRSGLPVKAGPTDKPPWEDSPSPLLDGEVTVGTSVPHTGRFSVGGNDFLTNRFLSDISTDRFTWNDSVSERWPFTELQTPSIANWEGSDLELQKGSAVSSLGDDEEFDAGVQPSVPNSSPQDEVNQSKYVISKDEANQSKYVIGQDGSDPIRSNPSYTEEAEQFDATGTEIGSDIMDLSDIRRKLSRPRTPSASLRGGISEDQSSSVPLGLQKKMIHSIASLVNPHARLAEMEAHREEEEYRRQLEAFSPPRKVTSPTRQSATTLRSGYDGKAPVMRLVNVSSPRVDNLQQWRNFVHDYAYGQDILSKLNFVGRSGTALDVRYTAHEQGECPEKYTQQIVSLYSAYNKENQGRDGPTSGSQHFLEECNFNNQSLEDFYRSTEDYGSQAMVPIFHSKSAKRAQTAQTKERVKSASLKERAQSAKFQKTEPLGRQFLFNSDEEEEKRRKEEALTPKTELKLDTVVGLIDTVTDGMTMFKEKLAPAPQPGFRQPSSTSVPRRPLSRPVTAHSQRATSPVQRANTPINDHPEAVPKEIFIGTSAEAEDAHAKKATMPIRPQSATVSQAVDWRGKITPDSVRYKWTKTRFGGHTYVKNLKPSLRTAGATTVGRRPKTAPVDYKQKWKTEKSLDSKQVQFPELILKEPVVKVSESDKNQRIPQAATNTVTEVDQKAVDDMLVINQLAETSDRETEENTEGEVTAKNDDAESLIKESKQEELSVSQELPVSQKQALEEAKAEPDLRTPVQIISEQIKDGVYIEVTAIAAEGRPPTPPSERLKPLQTLSKSEEWHFMPDAESQKVDTEKYMKDSCDSKDDKTAKVVSSLKEARWAKSIVRPDAYFQSEMTGEGTPSTVGRSAGRMPGGVQSHSGQVLRMTRRQNEIFKKAPPVRTPPSIPSPHNLFGGRSPRQGQAYNSELEHHARKVKSPRHFMEHVTELRKDGCRSAPPGSLADQEELTASLTVFKIHAPGRVHTAPASAAGLDDNVHGSHLHPWHEEAEDNAMDASDTSTRKVTNVNEKGRTYPGIAPSNYQSIAYIGRPIAQVNQIPDPDDEADLVSKQREAKAAVDIQRIFRGFVARNIYRNLQKEEREKMEDARKAAIEIQRRYRGHLIRKAKISKRPPLNPDMLEWAKNYKEIHTENAKKREEKMENLAQEMATNHQMASVKLSVIGPHVEIYDIYHPKQIGPTKREMYQAAVTIQKHIRGFLIRNRFEKLKRKATWSGSTWAKITTEYKQMLIRVQRWHGVERPKTPFTLNEMAEFMDLRRRYESVFEKRAFSSELEFIDVEHFFHECDLYPSKAEIDEAIDVVFRGQSVKKTRGLHKKDVLNLVFYIYVPKATGLINTRQSTWMNPIIDGVEAKKLIGSEFVEDAPLSKCADLVINSLRERREKEHARKLHEEEEEEKQAEEARKSRMSKRSSNLTNDDEKSTKSDSSSISGKKSKS
ncbi:hypothetical protein ACJMK2_032261 [Sinanodonta woodiana]|uniref:Uncharacterized protein n=1 Tax=Sinanodonta woodiana TaxID=1069815 RepID=A0ABD3X177_SINWO